MYLLNRYAAVVFCCLLHTSLLAGPPTKPSLTVPSDQATKVSLYQYLRWEVPADPEGDDLLYDIYLSPSVTPSLFRENLNRDWSSEDGMELIVLIQIPDDDLNVKDYLDLLFFTPAFSPETTYYWKVVAKDTEGNQVSSEIFTFTTGRINTAPTIPAQLSPANNTTNVGRSNVKLTWQASTDAEGDATTYKVYFGTSLDGEHPSLLAAGIATTSYTFPADLADQQVYYWQVAAVDGYDEEVVWSDGPWSFTIENYINDTPEAPVLLYPANGTVNTSNGVTLTWKASPDRDDEGVVYDVYADKNANPSTRIATGISQTSFTATFPGADTYYWKVVARDPQQASSASAAVFSFTPWRTGDSDIVEMIPVEGGTFTMGQDSPPVANEGPAHTVTVHDFEISKYPVTYGQYVVFLNAIREDIVILNSVRGHRRKGFYYKDAYFLQYDGGKEYPYQLAQVFDATETRPVGYEEYFDSPIRWDGAVFTVDPSFIDHPVRFAYYDGARLFAAWCGYTLPSEAEWEYAASGGKYTHHYLYSGSNDYSAVAGNTMLLDGSTTPISPVGSKLPNELGLYDMTNPIGEICLDYYDIYRDYAPGTNPVSPSNTSLFYSHTKRGIGRVKERSPSFNYPLSFRVAKRSSTVYTISGVVLYKGSPWPGLEVHGLPLPVTCDRLGAYFCTVPAGWSGTITPVNEGYVFTPQSASIENIQGNVRFDFTMSPPTSYTVSGKITTDMGVPVKNVKIAVWGETAFTKADGTYSIEVPSRARVRIQPELQGYSFSPTYIDIPGVIGNITGKDFTTLPTGTHTVTGTIKDEHGDPLQGVLLSGSPSGIVTDADGNYTIELTGGWSGMITPVLENFTFTPSSLEIDDLDENLPEKDFTGNYAGTYIISGRITADDEPVKDISITNASTTSQTDDNGYYGFVVPTGWSGTITPSSTHHLFIPSSRTFTSILEDHPDQDFTASVIMGTQENELKTMVYPNPSQGTFTITLPPHAQPLEMTVFSSTGAIVQQQILPAGSESFELTIPHAGMYLLEINGQTGVITVKLVVK